jgi:hypothetical protein
MAIALDVANLGTNSEDGSDTNVTLTTTSATAAAATILVALRARGVTVSSVVDNGPGLTWTQIASADDVGGNRIWLYRAYSTLAFPSGTVITVTFGTATTFKFLGASSFTGITDTSPEDTAATTRQIQDETTWLGAAITTVTADTIIVGLAETGGAGTPTSTPGGSVSEALDFGIAAQESMTLVYRIVSSTGTYTPTGTWSTSQSGAQQAHISTALKAAAGGGGPAGVLVQPPIRRVF